MAVEVETAAGRVSHDNDVTTTDQRLLTPHTHTRKRFTALFLGLPG